MKNGGGLRWLRGANLFTLILLFLVLPYTVLGVPRADTYEPNNQINQATRLPVMGNTFNLTFHNGTDRDYIVFYGEAHTRYIIKTLGDLDTMITVYSKNGVELFSDDDSGEGTNALAVIYPDESGDLYVEVAGYRSSEGEVSDVIGSYKLHLQVLDSAGGDVFEPDNTINSANLVRLGQVEEHTLEPQFDVDYFRAAITEGTAYLILTSCNFDNYMEIYSEEGSLLFEDDDGAANLIQSDLSYCAGTVLLAPYTGTIFIKIRGYEYDSTGQYTFEIKQLTPDIYEPNDTFEQASAIRPGEVQEHSFLPPGDVDILTFQLTDLSRMYVFYTKGPSDTILMLQDEMHNEIISNDDGALDTNGYIAYVPQVRGRYYLKINEYGDDSFGRYQVFFENYERTPDEPNDQIQQATQPFQSGELATIYPHGDVDYFMFRATEANQYFRFRIETPVSIGIRIVDATGHEYASTGFFEDEAIPTDFEPENFDQYMDDLILRSAESFEDAIPEESESGYYSLGFNAPAAGTYYLKIQGYDESTLGVYHIFKN